MASAEHDYQRFIQWLHRPEMDVHEDVRRIARLILDNFESINSTTRHRSQRSTHLVGLARQQLAMTDPGQPGLELEEVAASFTWAISWFSDC